MAQVLLDSKSFYVTSTITGRFKITNRSRAYTRKTNKAESLHLHGIIECLTMLGIPIEPKNEIFQDAISTFAASLLGDGNEAYRDYFSTPPHEIVYRIIKTS